MRQLLQFKAGSGVSGAVLQDFNISLAVVVVMSLFTETAFAAGYVAGVVTCAPIGPNFRWQSTTE
jgi:hypothetical protein